MKLVEISLDFFRREKPQRPQSQRDPEQVKRILDTLDKIKQSPSGAKEEMAYTAFDKALAPYQEDDRGKEVVPKHGPGVSSQLSDTGAEGVLLRTQEKHYGASRLETLEKELSDILDRINIH